MTTTTAQVRRLVYGTKAAFVAATSAVTTPLSAFITDEPGMGLLLGLKRSDGQYHYIGAADAEIDALQSQVTQNTQNIQLLGNQIGASNGPFVFGSLLAPYGEVFAFPTPSAETRMPMCYVDWNVVALGLNLRDYNVEWIKIATPMISVGNGGNLWFRLGNDSPHIKIYANATDAELDQNILALAGLLDTPGLHPFIDYADNETVWGWVYLKTGMPEPGGTEWGEFNRYTNAFLIPAGHFWPNAKIRIPFKFWIGPYWGSGATINFEITSPTGFVSLFTTFTFGVTSHGSEEGLVLGELVIEVISADSPEYLCRAYMELRPGSEALSQIIDLQPQVQEGSLFGTAEGNVDLNVACYADGSLSSPQFDLYSVQAILEPAAGDLQ